MNTKPEYIEVPGYRGETEIHVCDRVALHPQARLAADLMRHLSIAAGQEDGEDSAGRQKIRLMPPGDVAKRAVEIAAAAYAEFDDRGWLLEVPIPKPAKLKEEL